MAIEYDGNNVKFEGIINEEEAPGIRDHFQKVAPEQIQIDMTACIDVHTAVLQVLVAYQLQYGCDFKFGENMSAYQKALEGCVICEDNSH